MTRSAMMLLVTALLCLWVFPLRQAYKFVDLTHVQNPSTLYWPGVPTFNRSIVAAGTSDLGVWIEVGVFSSGEHGGTHIDVPRHFIANGSDLADFPLDRTVAEGVVIDCTTEAERDADYGVTTEKLQQWEEEHGRIPNEAAVLFRFGYAKNFWKPEEYLNTKQLDDPATYHFPKVTIEAARWLVNNRDLKIIGMDVPSPDAPSDFTYPVHREVLPRNIMILENVNIVPSLPPRDFRLHAAPMRIENGTGVQTRIYAMLYERMNDGSATLSSPWCLFSLLKLIFLSVISCLVKILTQ